MEYLGRRRPRVPRVTVAATALVLLGAGVVFLLPTGERLDQSVSGAAVAVIWLLLMVAQVSAARRTTGIDRGAWIAMIAVDIVLFTLFATNTGTESYLPTGDGLPLVWLLGPIGALEGLVVLLILGRGALKETNRVAFAADAAWLAVAAQTIAWPAVGDQILHMDADALTVTTILAQGCLAAMLAGTFGALILRTAAPFHMHTVKVGLGIVTLRYTSVIFYASWLDTGITPGSGIDFVVLLFMGAMVGSAAWGPEAAAQIRGANPRAPALLSATWMPVLIILASLGLQGFRFDSHWIVLVGAAGAVLVVRLSIELRQGGNLRELLEIQATTDPLTRLPNRVTLDAEMADAGDTIRSLMIIDLDRFKAVNDQLGHDVGDELLRQVAQRLQAVLGDQWLLSRAGGDEFIAMSTSKGGNDEVARLAAAAIEILEPSFLIDGREAWIGASIGVATVAEGVTSTDLLPVADLALRHAKRAGRGEVVVSNPELRARAVDATVLADSLQRALDNNEIFCLYQPKVDLVTGEIIGVEALVRWNHPERGVLSPADFLDVAESTGLIARLDGIVLRKGVAELVRWNTESPGRRLSLSTNMSPWQLARRDVDDEVVRTIAGARAVDPAQITIELTETLLIDDPMVVGRRLQKLRSTGVNLSVDDFGSGFTSVAHLRTFPISEVKIDRSLTAELDPDAVERSVAGAVIALAQSLELEVIAEGVETADQAQALKKLGCRHAQGYLFSPPVAADQIDEWLRADAPFAAEVGASRAPSADRA